MLTSPRWFLGQEETLSKNKKREKEKDGRCLRNSTKDKDNNDRCAHALSTERHLRPHREAHVYTHTHTQIQKTNEKQNNNQAEHSGTHGCLGTQGVEAGDQQCLRSAWRI